MSACILIVFAYNNIASLDLYSISIIISTKFQGSLIIEVYTFNPNKKGLSIQTARAKTVFFISIHNNNHIIEKTIVTRKNW